MKGEKKLTQEEEFKEHLSKKCSIMASFFGATTIKGKAKKGLELQEIIEKNDKASTSYWRKFFSDCVTIAEVDKKAKTEIMKL